MMMDEVLPTTVTAYEGSDCEARAPRIAAARPAVLRATNCVVLYFRTADGEAGRRQHSLFLERLRLSSYSKGRHTAARVEAANTSCR